MIKSRCTKKLFSVPNWKKNVELKVGMCHFNSIVTILFFVHLLIQFFDRFVWTWRVKKKEKLSTTRRVTDSHATHAFLKGPTVTWENVCFSFFFLYSLAIFCFIFLIEIHAFYFHWRYFVLILSLQSSKTILIKIFFGNKQQCILHNYFFFSKNNSLKGRITKKCFFFFSCVKKVL